MKYFMLVFAVLTVACAPHREDSTTADAPTVSSWSTGYGAGAILPEKIFVMRARTCEDSLPEATVELGSDGQLRVTRKNCYPVMPPAEVAPADVDHLANGGVSIREGDFTPLALNGDGYSLDAAFEKALRRLVGTVCIREVYVDGIGSLGRLGAGKSVVRGGLLTAYLDEKADIAQCAARLRAELPELKINFVLDYAPAIIVTK